MTTTAAMATHLPRTPGIDRATAQRLMATEFQRVLDQFRSLSPDEWHASTCNTGWDVLALAKHMLGMAAMSASLREQVQQRRQAKRRGGVFIDALTALQVDKYAGWSPQRIVAEFQRLAPKAVRRRSGMPGLLRRRAMPNEGESWTLAYLVDVILTRDPWMHRTDIAAAVGRDPVLTADHDGVIVDDVAREWAARHGMPCTLRLTGPLARDYVFGSGDGPSYAIDAVEFCRVLSGRGQGDGLLRTRVPF